MDDIEGFRAEARAWLEANATVKTEAHEEISMFSRIAGGTAASLPQARAWQRALADAGWATVTWPRAFGGRDASPAQAIALAEELARFDGPERIFDIGTSIIGPTLMTHASPEQQARYLPAMRDGSEIWCQLWSEPDAGSDLAAVKTSAVLDGDEWVLNGQKVWTSGAQYCDWGFGIFRTNADVPKHRGISCLIVDMRAPGIEIRPLRQITGDAHFNEVFLTDVRVPAGNLVGEVDAGWTVAKTTMLFERMATGAFPVAAAATASLRRLPRDAHTDDGSAVLRDELAQVHTAGRLIDLTVERVRAGLEAGRLPGAEGSILKLALAAHGTAVADLGCATLGAAGLLTGPDAPEEARWPDALLGSIAVHIGGGTDEIQRNTIAETVLGLPREPKPESP